LKDLVFSVIRTVVPGWVSAGLTWLAAKTGVVVDEGTRTQLLMVAYGVLFGAYYTGVRLLERYVAPRFSWFLGDFRKGLTEPTYKAA